jgi:hypothetical protein
MTTAVAGLATPAAESTVSLREVLVEDDERASTEWSDLPVLSLTKDRGLILQSERFKHRVATEDVGKYRVVRRGQLVYNPYVLWEGAIHTLRHHDAGLVSPVYPVLHAVNADTWYLDYLLRSPGLLREYERMGKGAVKRRRSVSRADFLDITVTLPSLDEQRRVATYLGTIQQALAAQARTTAAKVRLLESLRSHFLAGVRTEPIALRELLREPLRNGYSPVAAAGGTVRVLTLSAVTNDEFSDRFTKLAADNGRDVGDLWLRPGDILIERANTRELVGSAALYAGPEKWAIYPDLMIRIRPDETVIDPIVLNEYLRLPTVRRYFSERARGTAGSMPKIDHEIVASTPIKVPDREEQDRMKVAFQSVRQSIKAGRAMEAALASLFAASVGTLFGSPT